MHVNMQALRLAETVSNNSAPPRWMLAVFSKIRIDYNNVVTTRELYVCAAGVRLQCDQTSVLGPTSLECRSLESKSLLISLRLLQMSMCDEMYSLPISQWPTIEYHKGF